MKKLYSFCLLIFLCCFAQNIFAQACDSLKATAIGFESRCTATGSIKITANGGSGNYKYKVNGTSNTNFTSTDSITGLAAGTYTVTVNDIANNCSFALPGIIVTGAYEDPRFTLNKIDVSCDNGDNGSISVNGLLNGLSPFTYSIVAPSPAGVGTTNGTGTFQNLSAGVYFIRLQDSCGGIQTRQVTVNNYTWSLVAYPFAKTSCTEINGYIRVADSRGNISTVTGILGFMYGVVTAPGDTLWQSNPNFSFNIPGINKFDIVAKDSCGTIKTGSATVNLTPNVSNTVSISNKVCNSFTASVAGVVNFVSPQYCLYDSLDNQLECNSAGTFTNLAYGNYCITAYDLCTDTLIRRCFSAVPPPLSIGNNVLISNKTCDDFTATITGKVGITNPEYCLYDTANNQLVCNTTGVFNNLPYGNYCITTTDGCRDTTITRCFSAFKPMPIVYPLVPAYNNCTMFGIGVTADSLFYPQYCLYDTNGVQIECNTNGIFDSIPLGDYCVNIYDSCYDTTITRCFSVGYPVIDNDVTAQVTARGCSTFSMVASGSNLQNAEYCLYNASDSLMACNLTGIFDNLPYGDYCVKAHNVCPDTIMVYCFTVGPLIPSVDAVVALSDENCTTFSAIIKSQVNLSRPIFCIYDSTNTQISCNTTGIFGRLPFGRYCITVRDNCYDTTITRCFERYPQPLDIFAIAGKSCSFDYAYVVIGESNANYPVGVNVYNPDSSLFKSIVFANGPMVIDSLPGIDAGKFYTITAEDVCGKRDTTTTGAVASYFTHTIQITPKCPGSTWASGSGNIAITVTTNLGTVNVRIIKKDNVSYGSPLVPNSASGDVYTFADLGPGTYIVSSMESICNTLIYDTVTIRSYVFPNLNNNSAYQCDIGGFSVNSLASNGVGPYTYEIIGSTPSVPVIVSSAQTSTLFNINNGTSYSLVRLRALDACGNATLGDASILPLAINGIYSSNNCMWYPSSLSVDALYNATYNWYKKDSLSGRDSVYLGDTPDFNIPTVTPADTGTYICYLKVNQGCINRQYNFRLTGSCYSILPVTLNEFKGRQENDKNVLTWSVSAEEGLEKYILERRSRNSSFEIINKVAARNATGVQQYQWQDLQPFAGDNFYRLKMLSRDGSIQYSNTILLQNKLLSFQHSIYPNPVKNQMMISLRNNGTKMYHVSLYNMMNQLSWQKTVKGTGNVLFQFDRPSSLPPGMYMIRIIADNDEQVTEKLIFL